MQAARGFSLIELIVIIVVLGVASAFLATTFSQLPRSLDVSEGAQTASQLAQQCSERVLARRRSTAVGFNTIITGTCVGLPTLTGYAVTDVVTDASGVAPCPSVLANSCKRVVVTVTRNGVIVAVNDLLLVNF
jgi:prepilin-type N-terminal cleavage/methylation domain-containing protein